MKRKSKIWVIVSIVTVLITILGAAVGVISFKKRNNELQEIYMKEFTDQDVVYDSGYHLIDSQILLTAELDAKYLTVENLIKSVGGTIVGYIPDTQDYQVEFEAKKNYEGLLAVCEELEASESITSALPHYAFRMEADSVDYRRDPWIKTIGEDDGSGSEWSRYPAWPSGNNWWAEAVKIDRVWDMDVSFSDIAVGVYDSMFDLDQTDLEGKFAQCWNNPTDEDDSCMVCQLYNGDSNNNAYYHGTHVAGIIAARAGNDYGITGIAQNAELYGYGYKNNKVFNSAYAMKVAISQMLNANVRVINMSIEWIELCIAANLGNETALEQLRILSQDMNLFLSRQIAIHDFLIIKAAGNENGKRVISCEISDENPYGYKIVKNDSDKGKAIKNVDAKYDIFGYIEDSSVKNHIIVVGAAQNNLFYLKGPDGKGSYNLLYSVADYSNRGERVDIYAPGTDILSLFPNNQTKAIQGTSMATPIVTGIATLIYGVDPTFTYKDVREILLESIKWSEKLGNRTPVVNAEICVQLAQQRRWRHEGSKKAKEGVLLGYAYSVNYGSDDKIITDDDGQEKIEEISDLVSTIYDEDGNIVENVQFDYEKLNEDVEDLGGGYSVTLPEGNYTIRTQHPGFVTDEQTFQIEQGMTSEMVIRMVPIRTTGQVKNSDGIPIQGAKVELELNSEDKIWAITDEEGRYYLYPEPGDYTITVNYNSYYSQEMDISVLDNQDTVLEPVVLSRLTNKEVHTIYESFLSNREYKKANSLDIIFRKYAYYDLNQDGIDELILMEYNEEGIQSYGNGNSLFWAYDMNKKEVKNIKVKNPGGYACTENKYLGVYYGPNYDASSHCILFSSGDGHGHEFYEYNGEELVWKYSLSVDWKDGERCWAYEDIESKQIVYYPEDGGPDIEWTYFDWKDIPLSKDKKATMAVATKVIIENKLDTKSSPTMMYSIIKGMDDNNNSVWEYETRHYEAAGNGEILTEIGIHNGKFYYYGEGSVNVRRVSDGEVLWSCGGIDQYASGASDFGDNDTLYISGYVSPSFMEIDKNGKVVKKIDLISRDAYRPYKLEYLGGFVRINFEGDNSDVIYDVSLKDYSYKKYISDSFNEQITKIQQNYYYIEEHIAEFKTEDGGSGTTRYIDQNNKIRRITVPYGAYNTSEVELANKYCAEYYYEVDGNEKTSFVFVKNEGEEHRFYVSNGLCIRYIDAKGVVHDYPDGVYGSDINAIGVFCSQAAKELHWAYG